MCSAATVHGRCTSGGPVENLYPRNSAKLKLGVYILRTRSHLRSACFVHLRGPKKYQVEGTTCSAPYTPDTRNTNRAIEKMTLDVLFRRLLLKLGTCRLWGPEHSLPPETQLVGRATLRGFENFVSKYVVLDNSKQRLYKMCKKCKTGGLAAIFDLPVYPLAFRVLPRRGVRIYRCHQ